MPWEFDPPTDVLKVRVERPLLAALKAAIEQHNKEEGAALTIEDGASRYLNEALKRASTKGRKKANGGG